MAIDPAAKKRLLEKKICRKCKARNPMTAKKCRKCGYSNLRTKKGEKKAK